MRPRTFDIQGHRGARGLYPENTISGFLAALDIGVTTLEMDVVISKDRRVVVSHDPWFARTICLRPDGRRIPFLRQRRYRLFDLTYEEIAEFDCGSRPHPVFRRQRNVPASKPLLSAVIEAAERRAAERGRDPVFYSIETKSRPEWEGIFHPDPETFARLVLDVLDKNRIADRAVIQSFDPRTLRFVRAINPSIRLSYLVERRAGGNVEAHLDALDIQPEIYSPNQLTVDRRLVEAAHRRGVDVIPWTVNEELRMALLFEIGVDGLITDYPDVAVRRLGPLLAGLESRD